MLACICLFIYYFVFILASFEDFNVTYNILHTDCVTRDKYLT